MKEQKVQDCLVITELKQLLNQSPELLTIIDVKKPEEYAEKYIRVTINVPLSEFKNRSIE